MNNNSFNPFTITELPFGTPGRIFRSPMPYGPDYQSLIKQYQAEDIQIVVNLLPEDEVKRKGGQDLETAYRNLGLSIVGFPIKDFNIPDASSIKTALDNVIYELNKGSNIVVHCFAGLGRTGTFMACLASLYFGIDGNRAIGWVREFIPHAMENEAQERFVVEFGAKYADQKRPNHNLDASESDP